MTRKERCPECKKTVVGLYRSNRNLKCHPSKTWIRVAYYCEECKCILEDNKVVYEKITYTKRSE